MSIIPSLATKNEDCELNPQTFTKLIQEISKKISLELSEKSIENQTINITTKWPNVIVTIKITLVINKTKHSSLMKLKFICFTFDSHIKMEFKFIQNEIWGEPIAYINTRMEIDCKRMINELNSLLLKHRQTFKILWNFPSQIIYNYHNTKFEIKQSFNLKNVKKKIIENIFQFFKEFKRIFEVIIKGNVICKRQQQEYSAEQSTFNTLLKSINQRRQVLKQKDQIKKKMNNLLEICQFYSGKVKPSQIYQNTNTIKSSLMKYMIPQDSGRLAIGIRIKKKEEPDKQIYSDFKINIKQSNYNKSQELGFLSLSKLVYEENCTFLYLRKGFKKEQTESQFESHEGNVQKIDHFVVKKCKHHDKQHNYCSFMREYCFMTVASHLKCNYISRFFGNESEHKQKSFCKREILTKFQKGDLYTEVSLKTYNKVKSYNYMDYLEIFYQITKGIQFLSHNGMIHRDIKPLNFLFSEEKKSRRGFVCKMIDFGSCFIKEYQNLFPSQLQTTKRFGLTFEEFLEQSDSKKKYTKEEFQTHKLFDIYSIGKTIEYLYKYSGFKNDSIDKILSMCCEVDPQYRITAEQLVVLISYLSKKQTEQENERVRLYFSQLQQMQFQVYYPVYYFQ